MFEYCIIGALPPPVGGVSVYCSRKYALLRKRYATEDIKFLDTSKRVNVLRIPFLNAKNIEVNSLNLVLVLILFCFGKMKYCSFVDHNASRHYQGLRKTVLLWLLSYSRLVYIVNSDLKSFYCGKVTTPEISPFLPPDENEEHEIVSKYPPELLDFLQENKNRFFLNSAWKYIPYDDNDLYGIEVSIGVLETNKDLTMLLCIGSGYEAMPSELKSKIESLELENRLFVLVGQHQIWPIFKSYNPICLRLTPTDGDSVTVREALYYNCSAIVSNAVKRPSGCNIYVYGDNNSLINEIEKLI